MCNMVLQSSLQEFITSEKNTPIFKNRISFFFKMLFSSKKNTDALLERSAAYFLLSRIFIEKKKSKKAKKAARNAAKYAYLAQKALLKKNISITLTNGTIDALFWVAYLKNPVEAGVKMHKKIKIENKFKNQDIADVLFTHYMQFIQGMAGYFNDKIKSLPLVSFIINERLFNYYFQETKKGQITYSRIDKFGIDAKLNFPHPYAMSALYSAITPKSKALANFYIYLELLSVAKYAPPNLKETMSNITKHYWENMQIELIKIFSLEDAKIVANEIISKFFQICINFAPSSPHEHIFPPS